MTAGVVAAARNNNLFGSIDFTAASSTNLYLTHTNFGALTNSKKLAVCVNIQRKTAVDMGIIGFYQNGFEIYIASNEINATFFGGATQYTSTTNGASISSAGIFYQILCLIDTTQALAADRLKIYTNGSLIALASPPTIPLNTDLNDDTTKGASIGGGSTERGLSGGFANAYFNQLCVFSGTLPAITDTWDSTAAKPKDITTLPGRHSFLRCPAQRFSYDDVLAATWTNDVAPAWSLRTALT